MYSTPATFKEPPFQVSPYESVKEIVTAEPTIQLPSQSTVAVAYVQEPSSNSASAL